MLRARARAASAATVAIAAIAIAAAPICAAASDAARAGETSRRSPVKAFALSLLLPGLGQRYLGQTHKALAFHLGEAGLWSMFAVYKIQGNMREDDFKAWAKTFSGARIDGYNRDEDYYQTISRYLSSDEYNFGVKLDARAIIGSDDRAAQLAYIEQFSIKGDDTWAWASPELRDEYRVIRHGAVVSDRRANWTLGGLVLLRVVSAIDAALETGAANRKLAGGDLSVSPILPSGEPGLALGYSRGF